MSPSDYLGLHRRYARLLGDAPLTLPLSKEQERMRKRLSELFDGMMRTLHSRKGPELRVDVLAEPEVQDFINAHAGALDSTFKQVGMSDAMRKRLQRSDYIFSGMKTFHELNEAFPSLLDSNGDRKPFETFLNDIRKIDRTYNSNYLRAEYNFVQSSALMAAKWEQFSEDGDRYNLQYRTAGDGRVRPEHAALNGVTLPPSDPFWAEYFPPNGWNCRCTVVQVRKSKYPETPHDEAVARGVEALQRDTRGMFRFNPGVERSTVPDYNPYTIRQCRDCDIAKGKLKLAFVPDNELCAACKLLRAQRRGNAGAAERIQKYDEGEWDRTYTAPGDDGLVATQLARIAEAAASNSERRKFEKEMRMCRVLADNGHDVEYLKGVNRPAGQTYDITIDGIKADLKCVMGGAGNIVKYAKKALTKQGGEAVILELPNPDKKYFDALAEARRKCKGRIFFYIVGENVLKEVK